MRHVVTVAAESIRWALLLVLGTASVAGLLVVLPSLYSGGPAISQTAQSTEPQRPAGANSDRRQPKVGELCYVSRRLKGGVFILDACGRLYCRPDSDRDIIEVIPNFAERAGCTWTVVDNLCKCARATPRSTGKKS